MWQEDESDEHWDSVLDVYQPGSSMQSALHSNIMSTLLGYALLLYICVNSYAFHRKPQIEPLLQPLNSLLSSSRPNDSISEELAEMIGFEEIELVMEILSERDSICQEVFTYSQRLYVHDANTSYTSRYHNIWQETLPSSPHS